MANTLQTVVSVSIERMVAVCFPMKSKIYFTKKRAALGLVVQGTLCAMLNVNHLIHITLSGPQSQQHVRIICLLVIIYGEGKICITKNLSKITSPTPC